MKNKEIEEILNERKIDTYAIISKEEAKTILSYIEQLEKENQQLKKQKDDVVELIKNQDKIRNYYEYEECGYDEYNYDDDFKEDLLRMLGEIDE